jgi:hypothetical protein
MDPAFVAETPKLQFDVDPFTGERVGALIAALAAPVREVARRARRGARIDLTAGASGHDLFLYPAGRNPDASNVNEPAEHDARPHRMKETTMQYMLLIYGNEANIRSADKAAVDRISPAYAAYTEAMQKAGIIVGGGRLRPTALATTVRTSDGKPQVLDGPYAETKEQLGGYYIVDVPDLDAAISWAARCPGASQGAIEVRPIWT